MDVSKRNNALLWTGIGAATAAIVAVVTILKLHEQDANQSRLHERDINAVLEDCYRKISEIEEHLPTASQTLPRRRQMSEANAINN